MPQPVPDVDRIARSLGGYAAEGFLHVAAGLRHAAEQTGKDKARGDARHLSASELVDGVLDLAGERYGLLGDLVLAAWGIRQGSDIGAITFAFIEHGVFSKQDGDRREDFDSEGGFAARIFAQVERRLRRPPRTETAHRDADADEDAR